MSKITGVLVRIDTEDRRIFDFFEGYRLDTIPEDYELIKPHNARADDCEWEGYMRMSGDNSIDRYTHEELITMIDEMYDCYKYVVDNIYSKGRHIYSDGEGRGDYGDE